MTQAKVHVRELAAWGLDNYQHRCPTFDHAKTSRANLLVAQRSAFQQQNIVLQQETAQLHNALASYTTRPDLLDEMTGLSWSLGVVDLRPLIAFQRRVSFDPQFPQFRAPSARDWSALLEISFGPAKPIECDLRQNTSPRALVLQSTNPNLHIRSTQNTASPLAIHAGGPFFEVARFRGRWFLRDGYHRAYNLLRAGIFEVPTVIVEAASIAQLGAVQPWFFTEEILFSETPPLVSDFLNDEVIIEYNRPRLIKTLRITIEETLTPASFTGEQS